MPTLIPSLTSSKNPLLLRIRKAAAAGRCTEEGLIVAEGPHLLEEAVRSEWQISRILVTAAARDKFAGILSEADSEIIELSPRALASAASTETSQQIISLLRPRTWNWSDLVRSPALVLILDGIQDPGNAGTILRSAEAFGATGVVFLRGSVHISNGKLLRASAGSVFRLPYLEEIEAARLTGLLQSSRLPLYALSSKAAGAASFTSLNVVDFRSGCALAIGSEGSGVSDPLLAASRAVFIPTSVVESLNAAVAVSIALYQARMQRNSE